MEMGPKWVKRMTKALKAVRGFDDADLQYVYRYEVDRQAKERKDEMDKLWAPKTKNTATKLK